MPAYLRSLLLPGSRSALMMTAIWALSTAAAAVKCWLVPIPLDQAINGVLAVVCLANVGMQASLW